MRSSDYKIRNLLNQAYFHFERQKYASFWYKIKNLARAKLRAFDLYRLWFSFISICDLAKKVQVTLNQHYNPVIVKL